jgi:hypothetical protein
MPGMRIKIREYRGSANHFFSLHNLTPDRRLHTTAGHPRIFFLCIHSAPYRTSKWAPQAAQAAPLLSTGEPLPHDNLLFLYN